MRTAVIVGCLGQDGSYLTQELTRRNYRVIGIDRLASAAYKANYITLNIEDRAAVSAFVSSEKPDEIFYLAAYHHASEKLTDTSGSLVDESIKINTLALDHFLEAASSHARDTRVFYAASSRVFGAPKASPQSEDTPLEPRCAYGISKAAGIHLCRMYRESRGLFAAVGILYNHESPRRGLSFVTRKISCAAAKAALGLDGTIVLRDLDARVDWGWAPDYAEAMIAILQLPTPSDFIVATGQSHSVREFAQFAFAHVGLDASKYVRELACSGRPSASPLLCGDSSKLRHSTGWHCRRALPEIAAFMVDADMEDLRAAR